MKVESELSEAPEAGTNAGAIISSPMIDKFMASPAAALADVPDGATIMIGGFGNAGMPSALIDALIAQGGLRITSLERHTMGRPRIMKEMYRGLATL